MPRTPDLAFFVATTTDIWTNQLLYPCCACVHGVIKLSAAMGLLLYSTGTMGKYLYNNIIQCQIYVEMYAEQ